MRLTISALLVFVTVASACGGGGGTTAPQSTTPSNNGGNTGGTIPVNTVNATEGNAFNPSSITVTPGTTVTFTFGSVVHNVTFSGAGAPASISNTSNSSVTRTFSGAGTFSYDCTLHAGMSGKVIVQ